jgi:hypothetical protein
MVDEPLQIKSRYVWLRIPLISWLVLVFPLVLPPIPLGPIAVSLSWDRFEEVDVVKRARRFAGRPGKSYGFPMGWLVNVLMNLLDLVTLGLRSAFMAAWLADEVNAQAARLGTDKPPSSHVLWLLKWLLLGNVVFLIVWVLYPGWVLCRFVESMERTLYDAYRAEPVQVDVAVGSERHATIVAQPALSSEPLLEASKGRLTLLAVYAQPLAPDETREHEILIQAVSAQVRASAEQLVEHQVVVFWCNVAQGYPTHYQQVASLLPASVKKGGRWVAFRDSKVVCTATCASEAIAKALGVPATIRAIDNMTVGKNATELGEIRTASQQQPVVLFINGSAFGPLALVKCYNPAFLRAVATRHARVYFMKLEKRGQLGEDLRQCDLLWTGCAIWHEGRPVERVKMGWLSTTTEVLSKVTAWLSNTDSPAAQNTANEAEHRYRPLPCHVFARWQQVIEASGKQLLVLAAGSGMDTARAEAAFLRRVGAVFVDRGFALAVAPADSETIEGSVASGLRAAGLKVEGCYVVRNAKVIATIAKTSPQSAEDGWLDGALDYLIKN